MHFCASSDGFSHVNLNDVKLIIHNSNGLNENCRHPWTESSHSIQCSPRPVATWCLKWNNCTNLTISLILPLENIIKNCIYRGVTRAIPLPTNQQWIIECNLMLHNHKAQSASVQNNTGVWTYYIHTRAHRSPMLMPILWYHHSLMNGKNRFTRKMNMMPV